MAGTAILINTSDTNAKLAGELKALTESVRQTYQRAQALKAKLDYHHDGQDFTSVEAICGIPTGTGQTVFDLVNGTRGAMDGSFQNANAIELMNRLV